MDYITGLCASECIDPSKCSSPSAPCVYKPIRTEDDFAYYSNCTEVCGLYLNDMPNFDPILYKAFANLTKIRGHLSITNNKYIYSLDFLSSITIVRLS